MEVEEEHESRAYRQQTYIHGAENLRIQSVSSLIDN